MAFRFFDTYNKYGITTHDIEVYAKSNSKIKVDANGILLANNLYKNGAIKIFKGSNCHIQNLTISKLESKYIDCSEKLRALLKERVVNEYAFNITLEEDVTIYSLGIATNFVFGSEKSEWSDRFTVAKTKRKLGEYFICKYTYPTKENLERIKRFWNNDNSIEVVKEAEHSLTSDETSYLSEEAQKQSARIAQLIYNENKAKEQAELEEKLKSFNYDFKQSTPYVDKVLAYNKSKLDIALFDLDAYNTLYITGLSHSGKTYLCKEIAGKYCNVDTSDIDKKNDAYYSNLMWVSCSMTVDQFTRKFAEFCVHNKNKEKCLLVLNEATKDKLCYLLPMWEYMSKDGKKFKELAEEGITFECDGTDITIPKGLRILANVADEQNKNAIEQVINRFVAHIDMNQLTDDLSVISQYTNIRKDIIELLYHMQEEMIKRYDERKAFLVVYQLKYNKKKCLEDIYTNQCSKLFGPSWEGLKTTLREYIDNEI